MRAATQPGHVVVEAGGTLSRGQTTFGGKFFRVTLMEKRVSGWVCTSIAEFSLYAAETHVYRTEARGEMREVTANFWSALPQGNANTVDLDAAAPGHAFTGLGVSIPEASCYLLSRLSAERRAEILRTVCSAFRNPDGSQVVVIGCKPAEGDPFLPVQVQVKYRNRYLIGQALPNALTTVVVR